MNNPSMGHPVLVHWSDERRHTLPSSGRYVTVARFPEEAATWPSVAWSVVLDIRGDVYADPCQADARFLMPDGPHERLQTGVTFELLEGDKVTATVRVL